MTDQAVGGVPATVDVAVVGAGPAGLAAALNLVRARRTVALLDANRPRNGVTLRSHGFITRDGVSPLELRKLGREEIERYPEATVMQTVVESLDRDGDRWWLSGAWRGQRTEVDARAVVIATGLQETLPSIEALRTFYGTSLHSCVECDAYEHAGEPLAFICEHADVVDRALLIASWSDDLVVFTNGAKGLDDAGRQRLARASIRVEERAITAIEGDRDGMTGVLLSDGTSIARTAGFVRPRWNVALDWVHAPLERDADGFVVADRYGRTGQEGLYVAGEVTPPGPEQLLVAAGHGALAAAAVHRDLVGGLTDVRDAVM